MKTGFETSEDKDARGSTTTGSPTWVLHGSLVEAVSRARELQRAGVTHWDAPRAAKYLEILREEGRRLAVLGPGEARRGDPPSGTLGVDTLTGAERGLLARVGRLEMPEGLGAEGVPQGCVTV